jgi:hypothetical protein
MQWSFLRPRSPPVQDKEDINQAGLEVRIIHKTNSILLKSNMKDANI